MKSRMRIVLDGASLTPEQVEAVATRQARVELAARSIPRINRSRRVIDRLVRSGATVYGVNTGFGHLASVRIDDQKLSQLQLNLIRSHAAGVGANASLEVVRALLLLRANVLARGHSGVRLEVVQQLLSMLKHDLLPVVPEQGSVGASGDLAPLAHVALAAIGEGDVFLRGLRVKASTALKRCRITPLVLAPKEGLALVNGTQFAGALAALALRRAERLARSADVVCALSIDALKGTSRAFDARIHAARPHPGQRDSAANLRYLLDGSGILESHADCGKVQDGYSLRCAPQVHGATRDALSQLRRVLEIELNSSTDNPMVFAEDDETVSGGNFHAAPLAAALDYATLSVTTLAAISERRTDRLVNPLVSGLPAFLARDPGLESGLMMAQVTAAALVSECKTLSHPGSVDTIPTSANQEDHVSMAPWCARKLTQVLANAERVVAVELLAALRGIEFHRPLRSSPVLERVLSLTRRKVPLPRGEFVPSGAIEELARLLRSGSVLKSVADAGIAVV